MVGEVQFRCEGWVGGLENEEQEWLEKRSVDVEDGLEIQKMEKSRVQRSCKGLVGHVENGELVSIVEL